MDQDIKFERAGQRAFWFMLLKRGIVMLEVLIAGLILGFVFKTVPYLIDITLILSTVLLLRALILAVIEYFTYSYTLGISGLTLKNGIWSVVQTTIPYRQIQAVNLEQTFLERAWKVSKVTILTAGREDRGESGDPSEGILPVLSIKRAEQLRSDILSKIS